MRPGETLASIMAYRAPLYEQWADKILDCPPGQSLEETVAQVLGQIKEETV